MYKYSLYNLVKAYNDNSTLVNTYFNENPIEGYHSNKKDLKILGLCMEMFIFILFISISIWIWALVELMKNWNTMPDWVRFVGVIGLLGIISGGPIVTLIAIYITKK